MVVFTRKTTAMDKGVEPENEIKGAN